MKNDNLKFAILAVDVVLLAVENNELKIFLIKVNKPPYFIDKFALPGGLIHPDETAEDAVERHLRDKAHIKGVKSEQLYTFSKLNRDPRGRVVSVAYFALISGTDLQNNKKERNHFERTNNIKSVWLPVKNLPDLAYDHNEILNVAIKRLSSKLQYTNISQRLLPKEFTLGEMQNVYEVVLDRKLDKRNFRKKILSLNIVVSTGKQKTGMRNRPAEFYRFYEKYSSE